MCVCVPYPRLIHREGVWRGVRHRFFVVVSFHFWSCRCCCCCCCCCRSRCVCAPFLGESLLVSVDMTCRSVHGWLFTVSDSVIASSRLVAAVSESPFLPRSSDDESRHRIAIPPPPLHSFFNNPITGSTGSGRFPKKRNKKNTRSLSSFRISKW